MIKLKNILSEGYAWEREPGQPLPNMKTVQEKYQKNLKEQDQDFLVRYWMCIYKSQIIFKFGMMR